MFSGIPLFPQQASTLAADVDALYLFIVAVTAFFGILTSIVVIYFAAKYRTDDPLKVGARIHGSIPLELAWSIIPFLINRPDTHVRPIAPQPKIRQRGKSGSIIPVVSTH